MLIRWYTTENPAAEEDDYRVEVLIALRKLERLDKAEYTEDERNDAEEMAEARKLEEANAEVGGELCYSNCWVLGVVRHCVGTFSP